jgi:hypothetical protein
MQRVSWPADANRAHRAKSGVTSPVEAAASRLFFGSGRSGSTLLGQMLNYHPHCLIANELGRVLKGASLYQKDPVGVLAVMDRMGKEHGLYLIQLVRDPLRSARSYMKSHGHPFAEAYRRVVVDQTATYELFERKKDSCAVHRLFYEDLIEDPARELTVLLGWLGLECDEDWTNRIATVVDRSEDRRPRSWKEYILMLKEGWVYRHSPVCDRYAVPGRI